MKAGISDRRLSCVTMHVTGSSRCLREVANEIEIEHGAIWGYGAGEHGMQVFTNFGIDNLIEHVRIYKAA
ncbi:hypothetical protein [Bradyrhizobium sp. WSM1417]|uniref:hypothetical protein n=1 Tax=Bradyrhizobium sp. WSM1417 TaxID=754500 RepID=UPI0009FC6C93|nr:hypothetical protein [Bradyrhizobium sp. WSM1417]